MADAEKAPVRVHGGPSGLTQEVRVGKHSLLADEPERDGGTDRGPTPYDYLLISLGSCTTMTLRLYADRKKWPLESIDVELEHGKVHAKDCRDCETTTGKIDRIVKRIRLGGPLDEEQRQRLLEIADRCPVHRTLKSEIHIESVLV